MPDLSQIPTSELQAALAKSAPAPAPPSSALSQIPTSELQAALGSSRAASPGPASAPVASPAPDLSSIPTAELQQALSQGNSSSQGNSAAVSAGQDDPPTAQPMPPDPSLPYRSPAYTGSLSPDPNDYFVATSHDPDLIGHAFLALDAAGTQFQQKPTPQSKSAYLASVQSAVDALAQSPGALAMPEYQAWVKAAAANGLVKAPAMPALTGPASANSAGQSPAASPSGLLPFLERITGTDGREGTFHKQLDTIGATASDFWQGLHNPSPGPAGFGQTADLAAMNSNAEGAGDVLNQIGQQNKARIPSTIADMVVPGGSQGLLAHGAQAAVQGKLPQFSASLGPGIESEALNNPLGQMANVISLVGAAKLPLDIGASSLLKMGGKLSDLADAADAAGNAAHASNLRAFAQKAVAAGQDLKVASTQYGRTITGGKLGDSVANAAATVARKHFPGSGLAEDLTNAAMGRSLGKAVVDAYPGYKAMRDQAPPVNLSQPGDIRLGPTGMSPVASRPQYSGLGSDAPAPNVAASVPNASVPSLTALLGGPKGSQAPMLTAPPAPTPVAASSTVTSPLAPSVLKPAATGKLLHPTQTGENGAARYTDGTFAPQTLSAPQTLPASRSVTAGQSASPADARLVANFPVDQLHLDPDRFQYKIGYGKGGSSGSLTDAKAFNPDFAGIVHAWRDPADGKAYVVNGHNRVGLAQRTNTPGIDVRFIDAPDADTARTRGALINIAEGQGTALDAAKLFKDNGYTPEKLQQIGVNLSGQKATQGLALANLNDGLFSQTMRGQMPVERAAIIGSTLPNHTDQATLLRQIGDRSVTNDDVREMAEAIGAGPKHTSETSSLFGSEEVTRSLAIERAQAASYIKAQLGKDASALSSASRNADRLKQGNNVIDAETSGRLATAHRQGAEIFDATKNAAGPVSDILNSAAKRIAQAKTTGESVDAIKQDAFQQFQQHTQQSFGSIQSFPAAPAGQLFDDPSPGGSLPARAVSGGSPRQDISGGLVTGGVRPSGGVYEGSGSRGREEDVRPGRQAHARAALTPDGRQIALKGKAGTVYVNVRAYTDLMDRLGASGTSQGLTLRPEHVKQINLALVAAIRDYQRGFPSKAARPEGQQYLADLRRTANVLQQGIGGKSGLPVVKVEPGQTLSQTKAVARHEKTHAASYDYPLSQASRNALDRQLSDPSHPLHAAYAKAKTALTARGYAPEKTWDEIPSVLSAGPSQHTKMGLTDDEAKDLGKEYAKRLAAEHGIEGVRAVFAHGSSAARQVARQTPAANDNAMQNKGGNNSTFVHASPVPANTGPDEMRLLTLDEITDIRKAGLLSSPKTIIKAVAAHGAALTLDEVARLPASLTDFLVSAATGRDRTIGNVRLQDMAQAAKVGATQGIKLGFQVLKDGSHGLATKGITNPMLPTNHPPFHSGSRILDTYVNTIFQSHEAAYAALRLFALHRALLELADIGSINAVRRGLIPAGQKEAFRQHLYNAPSSTMMAAAVSAAEEATLTNGNKFSEMYQGAYDKGGMVGHALMSQMVAFPKIESNVAGRSLEMATGSAYALLKFALDVMKKSGFTAEDQQKFSKVFGRGLVGLGIIALGVMIRARKRGVVSDEKHHQPGQILYGGKSYPTNTVAPASNLLQLGIDLEAAKEAKGTGEGPSVGDALANLLMEQPWAQANPGDLTQMLTSGKDAKRQIGQQVSSYIPSGLADVAAQADQYKRKQVETLDYVKNRVPFLRNTLPIALDSLGNPRMEAQNRLFNPFGGTPLGPSGTPAMSLLQQDLSNRRDGILSPSQQATSTLRKSILTQAAAGKDVRPALNAALGNHQLSLPAVRQLLMESRETPLQQRVGALPISEALSVYQQASPAEKVQMEPVLVRKLIGAARTGALMPSDLQKAKLLGLGARR